MAKRGVLVELVIFFAFLSSCMVITTEETLSGAEKLTEARGS